MALRLRLPRQICAGEANPEPMAYPWSDVEFLKKFFLVEKAILGEGIVVEVLVL